MSGLPLGSIFSATHVSKWGPLTEDTPTHATQSRLELERTTGPWPCVKSPSEYAAYEAYTSSESSKLDSSVFSTCETTGSVRVAPYVDCPESELSRVENMAVKTYTWITLWFLLTAPVVVWDASYCFMRPRSMIGGNLHWIWEPYGLYQGIDYVYGLKALEENNGFTNAQSFLNLVETMLNLVYVYLAHVSSWPGAPLVGFAAATMTLSKTVLYWAQEYYCGGCAVGHNPWGTLLLLWVVPNGLWLLFPSMIVWRLGGDIIDSLSVASHSARKIASGKTQ